MTDRPSVEERHAAVWADAMRRARTLHPERIAAFIAEGTDTGLRASRYDAQGGRTTRVPCHDPEHCDDGPEDHSHLVVADPTGNAATRGIRSSTADLHHLSRAVTDFVSAAGEVLDWVAGKRPLDWSGVLLANAELQPGTIRAGIDVDHVHHLPPLISRVHRCVDTVAGIARDHQPRDATPDEQHWTAGLPDEDCCAWHLRVHRRYRRPRVVLLMGQGICQDCLALYDLGDSSRPPDWLLEAEVDRLAKPRAWHAALGRWLDDLGIPRDRTA